MPAQPEADRAVGLLGRSRLLWDTRANNHNAMYGKDGRVWLAATVRGMDNPAWCKKGSDNEYAKVFPIDKSPRQTAVLDLKTKKYEFIDTCFGTHHPQFGYDADNTLWMSGTGPVAGWINTKIWDETHDAQKATGWFPFVADTNGNGKLDEFTEPGKPEDGKDMRINVGSGPYAVMPNPKDGSIWYTSGTFGGTAGFLRYDPKTKLSELYPLPKEAIGVRGGDIDSERRGVRLGLRRSVDRVRPQQVQGSAQRPESGRRQSSARKASRSPTIRARASPSCRTRRLRRATTPSSISTMPSASARTCRSRPRTCRTASSPWSRARWFA